MAKFADLLQCECGFFDDAVTHILEAAERAELENAS